MVENALYALLGWAAGILSALILEWNKGDRTAKAVMKAVRTELRELSNRLAHVVYDLAIHSESLDPALLNWLVIAHQRYDGVNRNEQVVAAMKKLAANPQQVARDVAVMRAQRPAAAPGLKKYPTPALDAAVAFLGGLPHTDQTAILEIRTYLAAFDALVDDTREFFRMTFEDLNEERMATVNRNLDSSYKQALRVARQISDLSARLAWPSSNSAVQPTPTAAPSS